MADSLLGEHALVQQVRAFEEGLKRISLDGAVAYGSAPIEDAAEQGAIDTLVIEASMLRDETESSTTAWNTISNTDETSGGKVIQASVDHDSGQQLVGMGGAIALLRWKTE